MVFFPFHSPVLKPDLDLPFRKTQGVGYLNAPSPGQISVIMKFFLQFQDLLPGISSSGSLGLPSSVIGVHCSLYMVYSCLHPGDSWPQSAHPSKTRESEYLNRDVHTNTIHSFILLLYYSILTLSVLYAVVSILYTFNYSYSYVYSVYIYSYNPYTMYC